MATTLFRNARIITATGIFHGEVLVRGDVIDTVSFENPIQAQADRIIDVQGDFLSPGFIDTHTHGGGNADFMDATEEQVYTACHAHMRHGTTSIVPTTLTSTKESLLSFLAFFNQIDLAKEGYPNILGLHLEGPYFANEQRGAQDPKYLRNPQPEEYNAALAESNRILRWSFAVELPGSQEFLKTLREHHIVSSLAHSEATCEQVMRAYEAGVTALTHFYSCMTSVRRINAYRVAGAIEAGYLLDDLFVEVIADGCHLPKELLRLIYKVKGADHICLVTDSMRAAGMPDGEYILGSLDGGMKCI
ncbi:MAG: amidohydrolase family protein, partial [Ruthenibacterium sp.]